MIKNYNTLMIMYTLIKYIITHIYIYNKHIKRNYNNLELFIIYSLACIILIIIIIFIRSV